MSAFTRTFRREFKRLIQEPYVLLTVFILPLVFLLMTIITFSAGSHTDLPIAILDQDNSKITHNITRALDATKSCKVKYKINNIKEGKDLMAQGDIYALIVFPQHFESDLKKNIQPKVVAYYNNQAIVTGGILSKDISGILKNTILNLSIQTKMKMGMPKKKAMDSSNLIRLDERIKGNPYLNYSYFLTYVLIAHVFQIIITLVAIWSIGIEFKKGTLNSWMRSAKEKIIPAVFGKLALYFVIFFTYMAFTYGLYIHLYPAPFEGSFFHTAIGSIFFIWAYMLMGVFFVAITSNFRKAVSFGAIYTSLGFSFSGMTYPSIAMTSFGDAYSRVLPIRPFINLLINQSLKGVPVDYGYEYVIWLSAYIIIGSISLILLKKHVQDNSLCFQS